MLEVMDPWGQQWKVCMQLACLARLVILQWCFGLFTTGLFPPTGSAGRDGRRLSLDHGHCRSAAASQCRCSTQPLPQPFMLSTVAGAHVAAVGDTTIWTVLVQAWWQQWASSTAVSSTPGWSTLGRGSAWCMWAPDASCASLRMPQASR